MVGEGNACGEAFSHLSKRDLAPAYPAQRISNSMGAELVQGFAIYRNKKEPRNEHAALKRTG